MKVQDVMTRQVICCGRGMNAAAAAEIMWNDNCGALVVVDERGQIAGIVTDRDLFIALGTSNRGAGDLPVTALMRDTIATCNPEDDIHLALRTMAHDRVQRLPVVDAAGTPVGFLSIEDIVLRASGDGLSRDDLLATLKAIWSRQIRRKAGDIQVAAPEHAAA